MDQPALAAVSAALSLQEWPSRIGLKPGQNVLLSADITRIAWKHRRSGAGKVPHMLLDAFLQHLGPTGTLAVPTFDHDLRDGEHYDPLKTMPITGAVPVASLSHPAFVRTHHPMHSFAIAGAMQPRFLALDDASSFSSASPFALFNAEDFVVVGIDMDLDYAFSYFHHVEELLQVPYRHWRDYTINYHHEGIVSPRKYKLYAKRWGYANRLRDLAPLLQAGGAMQLMEVDGSTVLLVNVRQAHGIIAKDIRENGARSIVHFTWKNWLRDMIHSFMPKSPSRSQLMQSDARPH